MHQKENTIELLKHGFWWQQPARGTAPAPLPGWRGGSARTPPFLIFPTFPTEGHAPASLVVLLCLAAPALAPAHPCPRALRAAGSTPVSGAAGRDTELNPVGCSVRLRQQTVSRALVAWHGGSASEMEEVVTANISSCHGPCV